MNGSNEFDKLGRTDLEMKLGILKLLITVVLVF